MNEALIKAMARAIYDCPDGTNLDKAQAALAALKAEGVMLCKWERVYSDPDDWHTIDTSIEYVVDFDSTGDAYKLTGLEPPAAALVGRKDEAV